MKPAMRFFAALPFLAAAAAAAAFVAKTAFAEPAPDGRDNLWWIEARPWTCSDRVPVVARQVELACDASAQRCGVAGSAETASHVAILRCSPEGMVTRLDAEDRDGHPLWSVALTGDAGARAHKAAMWIARADSDGPLDPMLPPPHAPPPPPPPAAAAPPAPPPPPAAAPADAIAPVTVILTEPSVVDRVPVEPPSARPFRPTLDASLVTATSLTSLIDDSAGPPMAGARFAVTLPATDSVSFGAAFDGITTTDAQHGSYTYEHLGAMLALGAPYTKDWVGIAAEGGFALSETRVAGGTATPPQPGGYGKGTLVVQWPRKDGIRPYLSTSYLASSDGMNRSLMASLGLAWDVR